MQAKNDGKNYLNSRGRERKGDWKVTRRIKGSVKG